MAKTSKRPPTEKEAPEPSQETSASETPARDGLVAGTGDPAMVASAILDDENPPLTLVQYLVMNALFYGACLVVLFFVRMGLQETRGLWYFFGLIMISFSAVSLYDFAYDRLSRKSGSAA